MANVIFKDHSKEVLKELENKKKLILDAIGMQAEKYAKKNETAVDTGRLRNSITYATAYRQNTSYSYSDKKETHTDNIGAVPDKESVYIGTNVEYGQYIELGTRGRKGLHFLQRACTEHNSKYKSIAKDIMKED